MANNILIALKIKTVDNFLGGDARIAPNAAQHFASQAWAGVEALSGAGYNITPPARGGPAYEAPTGAKAKGKGGGKAEGGKGDAKGKATVAPVANIDGNRCAGFNKGKCTETGAKRIWPKNPRLVHYCSNCGGKHPAYECPTPKKNKQSWGNDGWVKKKGKWVQK